MVLLAAGSYLQLFLIERKLANIVDEEEPQNAAAYELEINLIGTGFGSWAIFMITTGNTSIESGRTKPNSEAI